MKRCLGSVVVALVLMGGVCGAQSTPAAPQQPPDAPQQESGTGADSAKGSARSPGSTGAKDSAGAAKTSTGAAQGKGSEKDQTAPAAADQFPFPGEEPAEAKPQAPSAPLPAAAPAGQAFPYPGEPAPAAPAAPAVGGQAFPYPGDPEASPSSSSSSSSSSSNGDADVGAADTETPGRRKLPKVRRLQSDDERVTEDLSVAHFYLDKGDVQAAYLRAQDAVKTLPKDSESHFVLAQVLEKMHRRSEAAAELQTCVQLEPDGEHVKQAKRQLAELK